MLFNKWAKRYGYGYRYQLRDMLWSIPEKMKDKWRCHRGIHETKFGSNNRCIHCGKNV